MFIQATWFFKWFAMKKVQGITLFPFVLYNSKSLLNNYEFLNHERIHIRQQIELLVIPFFVWYIAEFIVRLIQYKFVWDRAYRNISFEREAYQNQSDMSYLQKKALWSFIRYL